MRTAQVTETAETTAKPDGDWLTIGAFADLLPFSSSLINQLCNEGVMPSMRIAGAKRNTHWLPRRLADDLRAAVMSGGQVELRDFCRTWAASNTITEGVA
jgi:hypothetical protein